MAKTLRTSLAEGGGAPVILRCQIVIGGPGNGAGSGGLGGSAAWEPVQEMEGGEMAMDQAVMAGRAWGSVLVTGQGNS